MRPAGAGTPGRNGVALPEGTVAGAGVVDGGTLEATLGITGAVSGAAGVIDGPVPGLATALILGAGLPNGVVGTKASEPAEFELVGVESVDAVEFGAAVELPESPEGAGSAAALLPCGRRRELTTAGGAATEGRFIGTACGGACGSEACGAAVFVEPPPAEAVEFVDGERVIVVEPAVFDEPLREAPSGLNCGAGFPEPVLPVADALPPTLVVRVPSPEGARLKFDPCRAFNSALGRGISGSPEGRPSSDG
jgi:hypothetical protein